MAVIGGIDPGLKGAISLLDTETNKISIYDMPYFEYETTKKRKRIDAYGIASILKDGKASSLYMEEVNSSTQMGVVSAFSFGEGKGVLIGVSAALAIPVTFVKPTEWKRTMRVPADKKAAVQRASQLFPEASQAFKGVRGGVFDGRAESAILALLGAMELGIFNPKEPILLQNVN